MRIAALILFGTVVTFTGANALAADAQNGKAVFVRWCQGCHEALPGGGFDPPAGTYTLQQRYQSRLPAEIEKRTDLTAAQIKGLVRHGVNVMTGFRKTEITDQQLDDLIAYLVKP
jgi:mono/diheme cytochrome c family protein